MVLLTLGEFSFFASRVLKPQESLAISVAAAAAAAAGI
jgi:hypothetical protein